ncbi:hypothetical protein [Shewanella algidipiscicola]|uniref:Uncharacterized protein n=1 Tax=Shewanella algidipiscicola TaxID=614070 RepID=A0ABQ4PN98_9GAMM|nr:hypothetical protein [Shewanella algidipiscicola]GIU49600.1 hypothetical protein TUM4630_28610 [Shewanella algidipiscicola]
MRIIFILILMFMSINVSANSSQLIALGQQNKSLMLETVAAKQKHKFPALYVYDSQQQVFLSKPDAEAYLLTLNSQPLWPKLTAQWTKNTSQFTASNQLLAKALPMLKLDRAYLILYDNLPASMLKQLEPMDPELSQKDNLLKTVLGQLDSARSYTTY